MTTKVVVRVLDAAERLLGAAVHPAVVPGDGCLRASAPVVCGIAAAGQPATISVHWCDVNVETRVPLGGPGVRAGELLEVFPSGAPLITVGPMPNALPPVVVGGAAVAVPAGGMGTHGRLRVAEVQ